MEYGLIRNTLCKLQNPTIASAQQHRHGDTCSLSSALVAPSHSSPSAMADEEPVDQKRYLEESCKPKCVKPLLEYQACVKGIQGDESGHKHCTGQYFDYWSCVDKCVAPKLLSKLK